MSRPHEHDTKKQAILEAAREMRIERFAPAQIEQVRHRLTAHFGPASKTSPDYIAKVLGEAGMRVDSPAVTSTEGPYEEEFRDLLHFSTLEEAEMCLIRLDELVRKFRAENVRAEVKRALEVARLGRRRAEMIARNPRVDARKREEKQEIVQWFRIWLETPGAFFDWLEVRKQSPEYVRRFGGEDVAAEE
jgi:hypothetical protein